MTYTEIASQFKHMPFNERLTLLESLSRSLREDLKTAVVRPRSAAGKDLLALAGTISNEDAREMREAIELGCETETW